MQLARSYVTVYIARISKKRLFDAGERRDVDVIAEVCGNLGIELEILD